MDDRPTDMDLSGLKCPLPVLKTRKALERLPAGALLRVTATDPMSVIDIPHMCQEDGHALIETSRPDARRVTFLIRRGGVS